jgi:hypothetical protein
MVEESFLSGVSPMYGLLCLSLQVSLAVAPPPMVPKADSVSVLQVGQNLPGPFHPYNATGPKAGRYHCLVSAAGLEPGVLLFARGLEDNDAFKDLLKRLEGMVARNPQARLHVFVVFHGDTLPDPADDDDKRDDAAKKLEKLSETLALRHVVLSLGGKSELAKYKLNAEAPLNAVLFNKYKIAAYHALAADKVAKDSKELEAIAADVVDKLGAKK